MGNDKIIFLGSFGFGVFAPTLFSVFVAIVILVGIHVVTRYINQHRSSWSGVMSPIVYCSIISCPCTLFGAVFSFSASAATFFNALALIAILVGIFVTTDTLEKFGYVSKRVNEAICFFCIAAFSFTLAGFAAHWLMTASGVIGIWLATNASIMGTWIPTNIGVVGSWIATNTVTIANLFYTAAAAHPVTTISIPLLVLTATIIRSSYRELVNNKGDYAFDDSSKTGSVNSKEFVKQNGNDKKPNVDKLEQQERSYFSSFLSAIGIK